MTHEFKYSYTGKECVSFDFNKNFDPKHINIVKNSSEPITSLVFETVTPEYYFEAKSPVDHRNLADIKQIKEDIKENLLIKLFLLTTESNKKFNINLKINEKEESITNDDIVNLKKESFILTENIKTKIVPQEYTFNVYYSFIHNSKGNHISSYCGNGRHVANFTKATRINTLPNKDSSIILLTSEYLDDRVNNERNGFTFKLGDNNANDSNPIIPARIDSFLKNKIDKIILKEYPGIKIENEHIVNETIEEYPYLAKYIKTDKSLVKDKKELVLNAKKIFEKEKEATREKFSKLLTMKTLDNKNFQKSIAEINTLCARELAEYFIYREQIIKGLRKLHDDGNTQEADLHNLFMQMGDESMKEDNSFSRYDTNIWLLDDKYMSFTGIFSDKQISKIKQQISEANEKTYGEKKEPDLCIFYNEMDSKLKDLVVVEFKALDVSTDRKMVAYSEIARNLGYVLQAVDDVKSVYGYVITKMDETFCRELEMQPGIKPLFSNGNEPLYYLYNENLRDKNGNKKDGHIYFMSADTICSDAESRNKTFLDIIKNK